MDILDFIISILKGLVSSLLKPYALTILLIIVLVSITPFIAEMIVYNKSSYKRLTGNKYLSVKLDTGKYGEYLTYTKLKNFEKDGAKFLFNTYLPKENDQTSEIDILMISADGILVFESKNYSGWIFGNENQKNWHQTLPSGRGKSHKETFYNPVFQNNAHIKHLKNLIDDDINIWSVIVFSERCTLKNVQINSSNIKVVRRCDVADAVTSITSASPMNKLDKNKIDEIYNKLYPYTNVSDDIKAKHIDDIKATESQTENKDDTATIENTNSIKKCPRCGSDMVLRTASKGKYAGNSFWGCSSYPKCRYIINETDKA